MRCTVCQRSSSTVNTMGWSLTSERTPCSDLQIIFKLFYITHLEFEAGAICPLCHDLVVQIDALEHKLRSLAEQGCDMDVSEDVLDMEVSESTSKRKSALQREDGIKTDLNAKKSSNSTLSCSRSTAGPSTLIVKTECHEAMSGPCQEEDNDPVSTVLNVLDDSEKIKQKEVEHDCCVEGSQHGEHDEDDEHDHDDEEDGEHWGESTMRRGCGGRRRSASAGHALEPKEAAANFNPENLDYDVVLSKTNKGKDMLVYKKHVYHGETRRGGSRYTNIFKWKCSVKHRFKGCKGRLTSAIDGSCVLKDSVVGHCHKPPHSNLTKRHQFKDYVRDLALNDPEMKPADVIRNAQLLSSEDPETIGFSLKAITSFVQKVRRRSHPNDPHPVVIN